jgi:hypothetical protein
MISHVTSNSSFPFDSSWAQTNLGRYATYHRLEDEVANLTNTLCSSCWNSGGWDQALVVKTDVRVVVVEGIMEDFWERWVQSR